MRTISNWLLGRLSRVTSSGRFIPEIDGLRFVAIVSVLIYHTHHYLFDPIPGRAVPPMLSAGTFWSFTNDLMLRGWFGVELFFVISAFILGLPFAEQFIAGSRPVRLDKYLLRRVTRLEPTYLINLAITLGVILIGFGAEIKDSLWHWAVSAVYLHNLTFARGSTINEVAWSLEIEVQFYLLAPLLARVFLIRPTWLRRGILLAAIMLGSVRDDFYPSAFAGLTLLGTFKYFLVGFLLVDVYLVTWKKKPARGLRWDVLGIAAWSALPMLLFDGRGVNKYLPEAAHLRLMNYLSPLLVLACYVAAFRGRMLNKVFSFRWITVIGGMCYTIYLYHNLCLMYLTPVLEPVIQHAGGSFAVRMVLQLFGYALGILATCSVLFVLFERPFMVKDWPARLAVGVRRVFAPAPDSAAEPLVECMAEDKAGSA